VKIFLKVLGFVLAWAIPSIPVILTITMFCPWVIHSTPAVVGDWIGLISSVIYIISVATIGSFMLSVALWLTGILTIFIKEIE
jgi:hypothetical protein